MPGAVVEEEHALFDVVGDFENGDCVVQLRVHVVAGPITRGVQHGVMLGADEHSHVGAEVPVRPMRDVELRSRKHPIARRVVGQRRHVRAPLLLVDSHAARVLGQEAAHVVARDVALLSSVAEEELQSETANG